MSCDSQAKQGCLAAGLDIDSKRLDLLALELGQFHKNSFVCYGDISCLSDVQNFVLKASDKFGRIDFLFNNAGVGLVSILDETSVEQWDLVYDTNMKGTFMMTREVLPHMRAQGGGVIINNASDAGLRGIKLNAAYSSSKAGM